MNERNEMEMNFSERNKRHSESKWVSERTRARPPARSTDRPNGTLKTSVHTIVHCSMQKYLVCDVKHIFFPFQMDLAKSVTLKIENNRKIITNKRLCQKWSTLSLEIATIYNSVFSMKINRRIHPNKKPLTRPTKWEPERERKCNEKKKEKHNEKCKSGTNKRA